MSAGQLAAGDFADAQHRASQAAMLEQEVAGIETNMFAFTAEDGVASTRS